MVATNQFIENEWFRTTTLQFQITAGQQLWHISTFHCSVSAFAYSELDKNEELVLEEFKMYGWVL